MTGRQNLRGGPGGGSPHASPLTFSLENLFQVLTLITGRDFDEAWRMVILQLIANEAAEDAAAEAHADRVYEEVTAIGLKGPDGPPSAITPGIVTTPAADGPAAGAAVVAAPVAPAASVTIAAAPAAAIIPAVTPAAAATGSTAGPAGAPLTDEAYLLIMMAPGLGEPNVPGPLNDPGALQAAIEAALVAGNQPLPALPGRWYVITRGRGGVGVFQGWANVSPLVSGVPNACCEHVSTWENGLWIFHVVVAAGHVALLP